jgi:hypothetical protein
MIAKYTYSYFILAVIFLTIYTKKVQAKVLPADIKIDFSYTGYKVGAEKVPAIPVLCYWRQYFDTTPSTKEWMAYL